MSDTAIFIVGMITFLLLSWGLIFTYLEFRRLDEKPAVKRQSKTP
jgi:hypothetical protein